MSLDETDVIDFDDVLDDHPTSDQSTFDVLNNEVENMDVLDSVEEVNLYIASLCLNDNVDREILLGFLRKEIPRKYSNLSVLALQNIKTDMYTDVIREMKTQDYNHHRFPDLGCDVFVKNSVAKIVKCDRKRFSFTSQNKTWSLVQIQLKNKYETLINIVTFDLESGSRGTVNKREQIKELGRIFKPKDGATIILGNTEICTYDRLTKPDGYIDLWEEIGDDENEFTVDGRNNPLVGTVHVMDRRERIWYDSATGWEAQSFYLLSNHMDPPVGMHYGVIGHLTLNY